MTQGYGGLIFSCLVYTWVPVNNPDPSQRKHILEILKICRQILCRPWPVAVWDIL